MRKPKPPKVKRAEGPAPTYELRARRLSTSEYQLDVWQLPSTSTPHLKKARRVAGLYGRNLALVEPRVLRQLNTAGIDISGVAPNETENYKLTEDLALHLGLLFRVLAPMRSSSNMRACADGIEAMTREEAAYWLGMSMHRKYPRRVLMALRILLIDPRGRRA